MSECNKDKRLEKCTCSYSGCPRQGKCCECIEYHLVQDQLPGCAFAKISMEAERSFNRDFEYFAQLVLKK